jgi:hypothetical protein
LLNDCLASCASELQAVQLSLECPLKVGSWVLEAQRLQRLKLSAWRDLTLSASLGRLTALSSLELDGCDWRSFGRVPLALPSSLIDLSISGHRAEEMPQQVHL